MISYVVDPKRKVVHGILKNTEMDALKKIWDMLGNCGDHLFVDTDEYMMPKSYKVTVVCDPLDEFDEEIGKRIAKERIMKRYYNSLDKRILRFKKNVAALYDQTLSV